MATPTRRRIRRQAGGVEIPTLDVIEDGLFDENKTVGTDQLTPDDNVDVIGDVDATGLDQLTPDEDQEVDDVVEVSTAEPVSPQIIAPGDTVQARRRRARALARRRQARKPVSRRQKRAEDERRESFSTAPEAKAAIEETLGEWADDFDIDAIFDQAIKYQNGKYVWSVDFEDFWKIVEQNDKTAKKVHRKPTSRRKPASRTAKRTSRRKRISRQKRADVYLTGDVIWEGAIERTESLLVGDYDTRTVAEELARWLDIPDEDFDAFVSYAVSKADFADYQTSHETLKLSDGSEVTVVLEDDGMDYFSKKARRRPTSRRKTAFDYYNEDGEGLSEWELEERFLESLNEIYGTITLFDQYEYDYGQVVKDVDPVLFREAFLEWIDAETGETLFEEPPTKEEDDDSYTSRRKSRRRTSADDEKDETESETDDESAEDVEDEDDEELDLITEDDSEDEEDDEEDSEKEARVAALVNAYINSGLEIEGRRDTLTARLSKLSDATIADKFAELSELSKANQGSAVGRPVRIAREGQRRTPIMSNAPKVSGNDSPGNDYLAFI